MTGTAKQLHRRMNLQILLQYPGGIAQDVIRFPTGTARHGIDAAANHIVIMAHRFVKPGKLLYICPWPPQPKAMFCPIALEMLPAPCIEWPRAIGLDEPI